MTAESHPTEEDVYNEWGRHLTSIRWWNYPYGGSWLAPVEYEQALHDAPDRTAFIVGFRRLINAIEPILNLPDEDNPLFTEDYSFMYQKSRDETRQEHLHQARVNAKRMLQWLQTRQKPAATQLLEALEYIVLVPEWSYDLWVPTSILTVADYLPEDELTLRFGMLMQRLQDDMPTAQSELNSFCDHLSRFISYPATGLLQADFRFSGDAFKITDLMRVVPQLTWVDRTIDVSKQLIINLAGDFRAKLEAIISSRLPWAQRALELMQVALAKPVKEKDKPALTLKQIGLLRFYKGLKFPKLEEANNIAKEHGLSSGAKLITECRFYSKSANRIGRRVKNASKVIADIEAIIPHLDDAQLKSAHNDLDILKP